METVRADFFFLNTGSDLREEYCRARYSQFIPEVAWPERILQSYGGSLKEAILE
jgi:hypothetical protein